MIEYRTILTTTDFSDYALAGVRRAADLAERLGSDLILVYVVDDRMSALLLAASRESPQAILDRHRKHAEKSLAAYVEQHLAGRPLEAVVLTGIPHDAVVEFARRRSVDLIVVGTHGHGFVGHVLMGSTAERILHHAPCPVMVVRDTES